MVSKHTSRLIISRFRKELAKKGIKAAIIINSTLQDPNFKYFTNISPEHGVLFITHSQVKAYSSPLEIGQLKASSSFSLSVYDGKTFSHITKLLKKTRAKIVGINLTSITASEFFKLRNLFRKEINSLKFVDISNPLLKLRSIKTSKEIALYRCAAKITEQVWNNTFSKIKNRSLKTETAVKDYIGSLIKQKGLRTSFPTIVASGTGASIPHYMPQNKLLAKGFCYVDFGIIYKGYCTDITRTFFIGKPSKNEIKLYNLIFSTKEYAASLIKINADSGKVTERTRKYLGKYEPLFNHGLGHGIGLEIHELPSLKSKNKDRFLPGMIFTIEPGIYKKGKFGIRIEDDYLLTEKGLVSLTAAPYKLLSVY